MAVDLAKRYRSQLACQLQWVAVEASQVSGCEGIDWIGTEFFFVLTSLLSVVLWLLLSMKMRIKPVFLLTKRITGLIWSLVGL